MERQVGTIPKRIDIQKILVIGSGPIIIGQAAEFDYSGTQACRALREEGYEVVLINSNPATIMTDPETANQIYIEPITLETVSAILRRELPQGILATLGGQTGLNMAVQLAESGILDELNIQLLGTNLKAIEKAEDRERFKQTMADIGERVPHSVIVNDLPSAQEFARQVGFPVIIRPGYTLGGTGGGIARDMDALADIVARGLRSSIIHQVLLEESVAGWKEIEFEAIRDSADACVAVCHMENIDPVGIHTGDSIVVAPCQTLTASQIDMLKQSSFRIIRELGIEGGCNIQYALHPTTDEYVLIEVNPRLSRSSALASKATGYPIARVATKIAIGFTLAELPNAATGGNLHSFEPDVKYVVAKVPRWPFDKFTGANRQLGTQMKATGEVMALGSTMEEALLKAIDSLDVKFDYQLGLAAAAHWSDEELEERLYDPDHERIFVISEALLRGRTVADIANTTKIDPFFLMAIAHIVEMVRTLRGLEGHHLSPALLRRCKEIGFGDGYIANLLKMPPEAITRMRTEHAIHPSYPAVSGCATTETDAYFYSTYSPCISEPLPPPKGKGRVVVLGSGPIRIGQGIEFDYCSVHAVQTLRRQGYEAIIINSNPETVSTDFDTSDRLYFEPLTRECVLDIIHREQPLGVIVQFGGQTAVNLASGLAAEGVRILGTSVADIDCAENREMFYNLMQSLNISLPLGASVTSIADAAKVAKKIGYPVLVRPSYVLGGRAMEIVYDDAALMDYMKMAVEVSNNHPVLIDRYITGTELEVDAIGDGETVVVAGILEHVERAGVHSGDSIAWFPTRNVAQQVKDQITDWTIRIGQALNIRGMFNIQFVLDSTGLYVIEVNPRASRTVPILSKVTGLKLVDIATKVMMGQSLPALGLTEGLYPEPLMTAVKAPVFSFAKMTRVDIFLGPEMKSTGEVMGVHPDPDIALAKALLAAGMQLPTGGAVLFSLSDRDKSEGLSMARKCAKAGYAIHATPATAALFILNGLHATAHDKASVLDEIKNDNFSLIINTPTRGKLADRWGFQLRRVAMEYGIPCITSLDTAASLLSVSRPAGLPIPILALSEYK